MAYKFKAIEEDRNTYIEDNKKTLAANSQFGTYEIGNIPSAKATERIEDLPKIKLVNIKPREENNFVAINNETLKASIEEVGLINPLSVRKEGNDYVIISGHRRYEAFKEIYEDLLNKKATGQYEKELDKKIDFYSQIPVIIYEVVDDNSPLLGTDKKYITSSQEEKIYEASNLENRQISRKDLTDHILYFYKMIKENEKFRSNLLEKQNKDAKRNAKKINVPKMLSSLLTKDLGFSVAPSYIWMLVTLIESKDKFPEYHSIVMKRIKDGEKVKPVYKDYEMALEIHDNTHENTHDKQEYINRILESKQSVKDIYNEYFGLEDKVETKGPVSVKERATITKLFTSASDLSSLYELLKNKGYLDPIEAYEN